MESSNLDKVIGSHSLAHTEVRADSAVEPSKSTQKRVSFKFFVQSWGLPFGIVLLAILWLVLIAVTWSRGDPAIHSLF